MNSRLPHTSPCGACWCSAQAVTQSCREGHVAPVCQSCDDQATIEAHVLVAVLEGASALLYAQIILLREVVLLQLPSKNAGKVSSQQA